MGKININQIEELELRIQVGRVTNKQNNQSKKVKKFKQHLIY